MLYNCLISNAAQNLLHLTVNKSQAPKYEIDISCVLLYNTYL